MEWLDRQWNTLNKQDWYLKQIAAECRKSWVSEPNSVRVSDLQITFTIGAEEQESTEEEVLAAGQNMKLVWLARLRAFRGSKQHGR